MAKGGWVLYPDPVDRYPPVYARDNLPVLTGQGGGQTLPSPASTDVTPATCAVPASVARHARQRGDPHIANGTLSAQARYAAGTREILEDRFAGKPIREAYVIVDGGRLAGAASYNVGADAGPGGGGH